MMACMIVTSVIVLALIGVALAIKAIGRKGNTINKSHPREFWDAAGEYDE